MTTIDGNLARTLGLIPGVKGAVVNEPDGWLDDLALPEEISLYDRAAEPLEVIVYFSDELANVRRRVPVFAGFLAHGGVLWMATPDASTELEGSVVEEIGRDAGLSPAGTEVVAPGWSAVRLERV